MNKNLPDSPSENTKKVGRSLLSIASIVAAATLLSKVFGLLRQMAIAAAFGAGPAYDAYNYAYVVPGFLLILLGGINGPFHSAIVSVLSKRKPEEAAPLIETINTLVGILLLGVSVLLFVFAEPLIDIYAPGLANTVQGMETRQIAIEQFRIMAPMALLSGLIGIGFGALNASDQFWLPSVSPLLSSLTVLIGIGGMVVILRDRIFDPQNLFLGGQVLAYSTLAGAILQWLAQVPAQLKSGLGGLRLRFNFRQPGIKEIMQIMGPATFSSGMMQINVYTDLFFASGIPQAASALGYATLLVQTPLGIFSNVILVPLLPMFSRLADPADWPELKLRIRQGMMLTAITMLPLSALMMALAFPLVRIVYERYAFTQDTSHLVASVLVAYGLGMFVYLGRDVLVRVFYALGDGDTPFRISVINIGINAALDYFLVKPFGAPGLVLATVLVNLISMVALLWYLNRKLHGLPLREWGLPLLQLTVISAIAGLSSWGILQGSQHIFGSRGLLVLLLQVCLAGAVGLVMFAMLVMRLNLPEVNTLVERLKQRFFKSKS
jgi:putative peptidoglycan lipid II flippase